MTVLHLFFDPPLHFQHPCRTPHQANSHGTWGITQSCQFTLFIATKISQILQTTNNIIYSHMWQLTITYIHYAPFSPPSLFFSHSFYKTGPIFSETIFSTSAAYWHQKGENTKRIGFIVLSPHQKAALMTGQLRGICNLW